MNRKFRTGKLISLTLLAFVLGACQSAPASQNQSTENQTNQDSSTAEKTPAASDNQQKTQSNNASNDSSNSENPSQNTENTQNNPLTSTGDSLKKAFEDKGYYIDDFDLDNYEYSFEAKKDSHDIDVDVSLYPSSTAAQNEFNDETRDEQEDGYGIVFSVSKDGKSMNELRKDIKDKYKLVACSENDALVIEIDSIAASQIDEIVSIMNSLGYPSEK